MWYLCGVSVEARTQHAAPCGIILIILFKFQILTNFPIVVPQTPLKKITLEALTRYTFFIIILKEQLQDTQENHELKNTHHTQSSPNYSKF